MSAFSGAYCQWYGIQRHLLPANCFLKPPAPIVSAVLSTADVAAVKEVDATAWPPLNDEHRQRRYRPNANHQLARLRFSLCPISAMSTGPNANSPALALSVSARR